MSGQERRRGWPQWRGENAPGTPVESDPRGGSLSPSSGAIAGPAYSRPPFDDGWQLREPEADWRVREAEWEALVPQLERLHALNRRLLELHDETALMRETMRAAAELVRAPVATAQLRAGSGLQLIATSGLPEEYLDPFRYIDQNGITTCAAALRERRRVLVVNFDFAPGFAAFAREAAALHLRAAVSTPVLDETGEVAAVFTLYFDRPFQPTARELRMLDLCAQQVAPQLARVRVAGELHDSVGLNRALMEGGADCIQLLDQQGRVLSVNAQGRRVLGLDERAPVEGKLLHELADPECRTAIEAGIAAAKAGIPQKLEIFGRAADGTPRWWDANLSLVPDATRQSGHLLLIARDATATRRDEHMFGEEKRILGMVAAGRPLSECVEAITELVSRLDPGAHARVVAADEQDDASGGLAAIAMQPSPDPRSRASAGAAAGLSGEPAAAAGAGRQTVPAWPLHAPFARTAPASHGEPIFVRGRRAGSFLVTVDPPGALDAWHRRVAAFGAHIAGTMLERDCDVSEREQAQQRLLDSVNLERAVREDAERLARDSQWLAAIVTSSHDAILSKDLDGTILGWNEGAEWLFGYTTQEAVGQSATILIPDDRVGEESDILARIRAGEVVDRYETVRRHKGGKLIDVSLTVAPIRDASGAIVGASSVVRDIGARRQVERERAELLERERVAHEKAERLARDSARLEGIVDASSDAIIGKDADDIITGWNRGAEAMFGYTAEEALGQSAGMLFPADDAGAGSGGSAHLRATGLIDGYETVCRHKDGSSIDVALTIAPIRNPLGGIAGASIIARDVTLRRQLERERGAALAGEQEARQEAGALLEASRALAGGLDPDALLHKLTDLATRLIGAEYGAGFLAESDGQGESFGLCAFSGVGKTRFEGGSMQQGDTSRLHALFAGGTSVRCDDAWGQPGCDDPAPWLGQSEGNTQARSWLAVPVVSSHNGKVHGGLFFAHPERDRFDQRAERLLQGIAAQAAIALDNAHAFRDVALSGAHFRQLIDAMPAAAYATDAQGRLTHFNAAAAEFAGGTLDLGSDKWSASWKLYGADGIPLPQDRLPAAVASEGDHPISGVEMIAERADGTRRWFIPFPMPLRDEQGRLTGGVNMLLDISGRKHAETDLAQSQARSEVRQRLYDAVLSNSPDLVYVCDPDHRFIYANDALLAVWGKTREEALGKNHLELGYPGWHAAMHDRELDQVMTSKRPLRGEVPFTGAAGRRIYEYVFVPVLGPGGQVEAVAGTSRDITGQKGVEHRQRFLFDLSDRLRLQEDAGAIRHVAAETLARELGVSAAGFVEVEPGGETLLAGGEFCDGRIPDISGRRFSEQGIESGYAPFVLANENIFIEDRGSNTRKSGDGEPGRELGLVSGAGVALYNLGRRAAYLYLMHPQPRAWPDADRQLVREVAERAWSAVERVRAVQAMRRSEAELAAELSGMQLLAAVGAEMVQDPDAESLFTRIAETAATLMRADCATVQVLDPARGGLTLRAQSGLSAETCTAMQWLAVDSRLPAAVALREGKRAIMGDVRQDEGLAGSTELAMLEREGINAVQSTPLVSRNGNAVGMLSTHWRQRHVPDERRLAMLDLLARQAADLIDNRGYQQKLTELDTVLGQRGREHAPEPEPDEQQERRNASVPATAEHAGRGIGVDISPPILKSGGLAESLEWLTSQMQKLHGLDVILAGERDLQVRDDARSLLVYQVVRELLFNVVKYANVGNARIELRRDGDNAEIRVVDEGAGFDPQKLRHEPRPGSGGFGLGGAGERLASVGGRLDIESAPGFGACIIVRVPLDDVSQHEPAADAPATRMQSNGHSGGAQYPETRDPAQDNGWIA